MNRLARLQRLRRQRRRVLAAAMVAVPLLTSGCGPSVRVQLGMKNVPLDIAVGNDTALKPPQAAAPPVAEALPAFAPVITPVTPAPTPGFVPPAPVVVGSGEVCPELDPTRPSPSAATAEVDGPATNGKWPNRNSGTFTVNGLAISLPTEDTWVIGGAGPASQGAYAFQEQGTVLGFPHAMALFTASNSTSAPANPLVSPTSSFGLGQLLINSPAGALDYAPARPLKLLATPAQAYSAYQPDPSNPAIPGTTGSWTDSQSDAQDGLVMSINATNLGTVRVNACGTPVDAWEVSATMTLTGATYAGTLGPRPGKTDVTFSVHYAVATGLGGMIVDEQVQTVPNADGTPSTLAGVLFTTKVSSTLSSPQPRAS